MKKRDQRKSPDNRKVQIIEVRIIEVRLYLPNSPVSPTFMGPLTALCFAMLAILAKLSFSPYLPNSSASPTFMGPPNCFVLCLVGDSGKIVIFAIFAKFASIANFYGPPHCFVLCPVGDSGKIVIFAIFAIMFSFLPFLLLRAFMDISHISTTSRVRPHYRSPKARQRH